MLTDNGVSGVSHELFYGKNLKFISLLDTLLRFRALVW